MRRIQSALRALRPQPPSHRADIEALQCAMDKVLAEQITHRGEVKSLARRIAGLEMALQHLARAEDLREQKEKMDVETMKAKVSLLNSQVNDLAALLRLQRDVSDQLAELAAGGQR